MSLVSVFNTPRIVSMLSKISSVETDSGIADCGVLLRGGWLKVSVVGCCDKGVVLADEVDWRESWLKAEAVDCCERDEMILRYECQSAGVNVLRKIVKVCRLALTALALWERDEGGMLGMAVAL
jgi:hypothetical protein